MKRLLTILTAVLLATTAGAQQLNNFTLPEQGDEGAYSIWLQGMAGRVDSDDNFEYDVNNTALGLGFEWRAKDNMHFGLGYDYTNADYSGNTDAKMNTVLTYGELKFSQWFVNMLASYTWGNYEADTALGTIKFKNPAFRMQGMAGKDFLAGRFIITPTAGARYVYVNPDQGSSDDLFTLLAGAKAAIDFEADNIGIRPELGFAVGYDVTRPSSGAIIPLSNGAAIVGSDKINKLSLQPYASLMFALENNFDIIFSYEGDWRKDFTNHTGLLTLRYSFGPKVERGFVTSYKTASLTSNNSRPEASATYSDSDYNPQGVQVQYVPTSASATVPSQNPVYTAAYTAPVVAAPAAKKVTVGNLFYENGIYSLGPKARAYLTAKAAEIKAAGYSSIVVSGHTDNVEVNPSALSQKRAVVVTNYLAQQGIDQSKIQTFFFGAKSPAEPNTTAAGQKANRRVEVKVD